MVNTLIRIIIADDEVDITQRIASRITKETGFEVVGIAHNGFDAYELIERLNVDVLLTDIHMPFIDGIELSRMVRQQYPKLKIAFISGYDEFEYAKEAIKLDVMNYLLKPIDDDEFFSLLKLLKSKIDEENQVLFNQEQLDTMFNENRQALIENHFNSLIHAYRIQSFDLQKFRIFNIDLSYGYFVTGIISIDSIADFYEVEYLRIFLINLLKKIFKEEINVYTFNSIVGLVFILQYESRRMENLEMSLNDLVQTKNAFSAIQIQVGVSLAFDDFTLFPQSILEAKEAISFSPYINVGSLVFYQDIKSKETIDSKLSHQEIESIQSIIKFGSEESIHLLFKQLSQKEVQITEKLMNNQNHIISLAHIVLDYASSLNINFEEVEPLPLMDQLKAFRNLSEVYQYIENIVLKIKKIYHSHTQSSSNELFKEAIAYLENNFQNPLLGMDSACEKLGISVSYLNNLFNKHLDTSFNKELIKIRMEKAKELLRFTNKKIYEVAEEVGYSDVYYFSFSFKKYTLKSPKEFRSET